MKKKILAVVLAAVMLIGTAAVKIGADTAKATVAFGVTTNGTGNPDDPPPM